MDVDAPAGDRDPTRLVTFTDAGVAIALTLLALPLIEIPRAADGGPLPLPEVLEEKLPQLIGFLLSFAVVSRLWWAQHGTFSQARRWTLPLVIVDLTWLCTIVLLSAVTALLPPYLPTGEPLVAVLYLAVLLASSAALSVLALMVHLDPRVGGDRDAASRHRVVGNVATGIVFTIALVLAAVFPPARLFGLLLLPLSGRIEHVINRRLDARAARR